MPMYLAIRDVDPTDATPDPETGRPADRYLAPQVPEAWTVRRIWAAPAPTWTVRRLVGRPLTVARVNAIGGRALYAIRADASWLDALPDSEAMPARECIRRALAGEATPRQILRAWRWARVDVTESATQDDVDAGRAAALGDPVQLDGVVRELSAPGVLLPAIDTNPPPWDLDADGNEVPQASAVRRVRAYLGPVLAPGGARWTIAGRGDARAFETEPDPEGVE